MKTLIFTFFSFMLLATSALAVPYLQLDIIDDDGRTYNGINPLSGDPETIVSGSDNFTLRALIKDYDNVASHKFRISAALTPKTSTPGDYGSFTFNNNTYHVTADMEYGTPPLEILSKNQDLQSHGIFETYYQEFEFEYTDFNQTIASYDTMDGSPGPVNETLSYAEFEIDVSGLTEGKEIHFDFYSVSSNGTVIEEVAPFSHDAESGGGDTPGDTPVPEPATLFLLGFGLIGLAGIGRKKIV